MSDDVFGDVRFKISRFKEVFAVVWLFPCGLIMRPYFLESIHPQYQHYHNGGNFMFWIARYLPI